MKNIAFISCLFIFLHTGIHSFSQDEFLGPFPSWADAKKRFGAAGDGKADDTKSLQRALDSLSNMHRGFNAKEKAYTVLYLPAGTYIITSTLVLKGKIGVAIIGEDPATTIIKWKGNDNDTMFWANGSAYFKLSRLTWHAGNKKNMECVGIHWKEKWNDNFSQSYATLNIELSDLIFKGNPAFGISGGTLGGGGADGTGSNDSEIAIKRCCFYDCSQAGIRITGYNALDYWIWDSKFLDCYIGVWNVLGNYHIYRSLFRRSKLSDIHNRNGYYTSVRESFSDGSHAFSIDEGGSCNPFKRIFQGNIIVNTVEIPIEYYHLGCITLLDNQISKSASTEYPTLVNHKCWCSNALSMLSVGNTYGVDEPLRLVSEKPRFIRSADKIRAIPLNDGAAFEKKMPVTPARLNGKIFEVLPGATTEIIQKIINNAARLKGSRPVVHFGPGKYFINKPLVIPAGTDMRITGDGLLYATQLLPSDLHLFANKFLLEVNGPSLIALQDIQLGYDGGSANAANAILFKNIDQRGSVIIMDQLYSEADTSLLAEGLNNIYIEKNNSFFSSGNYLSGGQLQKAGNGSFTVNCFGGQFAGLTVLNNAKFIAKDCWWEGPVRQPIHLTGNGDITIDGAMVAPNNADSLTTISIGNFEGKISLLNMYIQGGLDIKPSNKDLWVFGWNLHFYYKLKALDFIRNQSSYKAMFAGISVQNFDKNNPVGNNPFFVGEKKLNVADENAFATEMLKQTRRAIPMDNHVASGSSSFIKLSRVTLGLLKKGIKII
ncbi:MAG: glycosyl hydrolase family 28-related protein [Bacteroidota bacterium]